MKSLTKLAAGVACSCLLMTSAKAITIVDWTTYGVGTFNPFIIPSAVDNSYVQNMINTYNAAAGPATIGGETYTPHQGTLTPPPNLPNSPSLGGNVSVANGPLSFNIDLGAGGAGNYLLAGWDGPQGIHAVYYIGGLTGIISLNNDIPGNNSDGQPFSRKGLSNYWLSGGSNVPDGGSTLALLGFALTGVGLLRRKIAKA